MKKTMNQLQEENRKLLKNKTMLEGKLDRTRLLLACAVFIFVGLVFINSWTINDVDEGEFCIELISQIPEYKNYIENNNGNAWFKESVDDRFYCFFSYDINENKEYENGVTKTSQVDQIKETFEITNESYITYLISDDGYETGSLIGAFCILVGVLCFMFWAMELGEKDD